MTEHEQAPDPYWQEDVAIGEGRFSRGETFSIRMRLHSSTERYSARHEVVPLSRPATERTYVHAKPYILLPDITLSIGLYRQPDESGAIGQVQHSEWEGMRHEAIGQMQGWYYASDQLVVLWECFPEARFRGEDPTTDELLTTLWTGFEGWLTARFPDAERIATTWEDLVRPGTGQWIAA